MKSKKTLTTLIFLTALTTLTVLLWKNQNPQDPNKLLLDLTFESSAPEGSIWQEEDLCVFGKCILLEGKSVDIKLDHSLKTPFTFTTWIRPTATSSATIASFKDAKFSITDQGKLEFSIPNTKYLLLTTNSLEPAVWQHVALVVNKDSVRIYINGSLEANSSSPLFTIHSPLFTLGPLTGFLDEVKLYNRALTDQEIIDEHANMILYLRGEK